MIVAVDPASITSGICLGREDGTRPHVILVYEFRRSKSIQWTRRIRALEQHLGLLCESDDVVAFERSTNSRNTTTVRRSGAVEYVVVKVAQEAGISPILSIDTKTIETSGFGKHHMEATARLLGRTPTEDEADAVAVYVVAWEILNNKKEHKFVDESR